MIWTSCQKSQTFLFPLLFKVVLCHGLARAGIHNLGARKGALKSVNVSSLTRSEVYNNVDEKNSVREAVEGYPAG